MAFVDCLPCMYVWQMHINPAAAEATILSLNQSSQPYKACQFILGKCAAVVVDFYLVDGFGRYMNG